MADRKLIFKKALDHLASRIILVHSHPSGNLNPSEQDRGLTRKLAEAGKHLEDPVLDHVIFAKVGYFSFADEGLL
ncbi:JAB domain-containing protein [Lunatibacter salilacus]|uniref:JAB domain-containing protein n=1 Tax=Lunatibacter salilacus TaxID=2483804 RepID=UPI00131DA80E